MWFIVSELKNNKEVHRIYTCMKRHRNFLIKKFLVKF